MYNEKVTHISALREIKKDEFVLISIPIEDICTIEAEGRDHVIYTKNSKEKFYFGAKYFENLIDTMADYDFANLNRGMLANYNLIEAYDPHKQEIHFPDGRIVAIARRAEELMRKIIEVRRPDMKIIEKVKNALAHWMY